MAVPATRERMLARLRFALERLIVRGLRYRLLLASAIVLVVAVTAGLLAALFDGGSTDLSEHVWWAFLRLTDPGYLGDDEGLVRRSLSTIVTVLGYLLFLGLLIAILTQWLERLIARLESGVTPIALANHVVLLGWSHRTATIVSELLQTGSRLERFLARHDVRELRIVIMAEHVDGSLLQELRERVGTLWSDRQVLLRSGSPLRMDHLERVAFRGAAALILPGADFGVERPERVDAQTVKTLMALSEYAAESGAPPPLAVAEVYDARRALVARSAYAGDSEILATDQFICRLMAESLRQRGVCAVFCELLTLNRGCAVYVRQVEGLVGAEFGDVRAAFPDAIVLGTVRSGEGWPALNPDPGTVLQDGDLLVFVARSFEDCAPTQPARAIPAPPPAARPEAPTRNHRVLILGWSRKVPTLLEDLAKYEADAFEIDVVSSTSLQEREEALERHGASEPRLPVRQIQAGFTAPGVLECLEPQHYDNILILASERLDEEEQADAATVFAYQLLRGLLSEEASPPEIFVELMDEENVFLFRREPHDVIVSPLLASYLLSQVALRRELAAVFAELSRPRGARIVLHPARELLSVEAVRFGDVESAAIQRGEIALGFVLHGDSEAGLVLNPDRERDWKLGLHDQVVVLETQIDRRADLT